MKKFLALSVALVLCLSAIALAGETSVQGTITKLDMDQKVLVVKDASGKETSINWDASTRVSGGELKEGASVQVSLADRDGKMIATNISVKPAAKPY